MNPGALRSLISVWDCTSAPAGSDYTNPGKTLVCRIRAEKRPVSTRETWEAYAAQARNVVNFCARLRRDIRVGYLVECDGQYYEIIAVQLYEGAPGSMILKSVLREAK